MRAHDILRKVRLDPDRETPHLDVRRALFEVLEEGIGFDGTALPERSEAEVAGTEPHLFLAWCRDGDADYFAAVPESLVSPELESSLSALRSTSFVGAEDLSPAGCRFAPPRDRLVFNQKGPGVGPMTLIRECLPETAVSPPEGHRPDVPGGASPRRPSASACACGSVGQAW